MNNTSMSALEVLEHIQYEYINRTGRSIPPQNSEILETDLWEAINDEFKDDPDKESILKDLKNAYAYQKNSCQILYCPQNIKTTISM